MADSDHAISWRLIDGETRTLIETINSLKSHPHSLGMGSEILLLEELSGKSGAGPRSHMWLLQAAAKYADYRPSTHAAEWKTRVTEWVNTAEKAPDDIWQSLSVVHLLGTIAEVEPDYLRDLESPGFTSELRNQVISRFENEVKDGRNPYVCYWLYQAIAITDPAAAKGAIADVNWVARVDKELAAATASITEVNHLHLASATSLALLSGQCKTDGSREGRHIDAAIRMLSGSGDLPAKRTVVDHGKYRFVHSLPFEELLILGKVAPTRFPAVLPRFVKLTDFLEPRLRKIGDDAFGVSEESSPHYPEVAPYATGYMAVLTDHVLRALRFSLKRRLAERLQKRDLPGKPGPAGNASSPLLDTEERVFGRLSEDLAGCIVNGVMEFNRLSSKNTILLFGPPGTGKTTVVEQLARHLNVIDRPEPTDPWYFLPLTPSVFLVSDSFSELLENVEDIFAALLETERAVFFFDEAEELMRRRDKDDSRIGRLFTSAMLIHLNKLKKAHSVSIFATNFIDMIDEAASRKGRFAIRKGVGPVSLDDMKSYVDKELSTKSPQERDLAKELLRNRVGMEVVQLCALAKSHPVVNRELFDRYRPIIAKDSLEEHRNYVKEYDDQ
jgi:ATPase family associated with various cellular activities (AAA)